MDLKETDNFWNKICVVGLGFNLKFCDEHVFLFVLLQQHK